MKNAKIFALNALMMFQKVMCGIIGDLDFVIVYIDDVCDLSRSIEEHIEHLRIVLLRFKIANLKINPEKSKCFTIKINLLGHIISENGIKMDPSKIKALKENQKI